MRAIHRRQIGSPLSSALTELPTWHGSPSVWGFAEPANHSVAGLRGVCGPIGVPSSNWHGF